MANDYFDFLNQNSQQEKPAHEEPKEESVSLTTRADAECTVMCDGDFLELLAANQVVKIKAPVGQHFLQFISTAHPDIVIEKVVDFPVAGKNHVLLINEFQALISAKIDKAKQEEAAAEAKAQAEAKARAEAEAAMKKAEEEARKKANAETIESFQKLISGEMSDFSGAFELIRKAAELGHAPAQACMGSLYDCNPEDMPEWFQKAAKQRVAPGEIEFDDVDRAAAKWEVFNDVDRAAVKWYLKAAEQGDSFAQGRLGDLYHYYDYTESIKWSRMAAKQGNIYAQNLLAYFYGDILDKTEDEKWLRMAAERGNKDAKEALKRIGD